MDSPTEIMTVSQYQNQNLTYPVDEMSGLAVPEVLLVVEGLVAVELVVTAADAVELEFESVSVDSQVVVEFEVVSCVLNVFVLVD